ncbi:MAG: cell division protein ZapA [Firmicutes bacterium]|nr:cell division protein ZapA [Bacillota bacterium]
MSISDRNKVKVRICKQDYVFVSPAEPEYIIQLAHLVEERIREITDRDPRLGLTRAAVMAGMIMADQIMSLEKKVEQLTSQLKETQATKAKMQTELARAKAIAAKRAKRRRR